MLGPQIAIVWIGVIVFAVTAAITLLALLKIVDIEEKYKDKLFYILLSEVVISSVAYYGVAIFSDSEDPEDLQAREARWLNPTDSGFMERSDWVKPDERILADFEDCRPIDPNHAPNVLNDARNERFEEQMYCSRLEYRQQCTPRGTSFRPYAAYQALDERVIRYDYQADRYSIYRVSNEGSGSTQRTFVDRRDERFRQLQEFLRECAESTDALGAFMIGSNRTSATFYHSGYQTRLPTNCFCDRSSLNPNGEGVPIRITN